MKVGPTTSRFSARRQAERPEPVLRNLRVPKHYAYCTAENGLTGEDRPVN